MRILISGAIIVVSLVILLLSALLVVLEPPYNSVELADEKPFTLSKPASIEKYSPESIRKDSDSKRTIVPVDEYFPEDEPLQLVKFYIEKNWHWLWVAIFIPLGGLLWHRRKVKTKSKKTGWRKVKNRTIGKQMSHSIFH